MRGLISAVVILVSTCLTHVLCNNSPYFSFPSADYIIKPEDTANGTILTTLTAKDQDGPQELYFSILPSTAKYVTLSAPTGDSTTGRTVDIILIAELDRDFTPKSNLKLRFNVDDNHGGEGNIITKELTLFITDVNDEKPAFGQSRYELDVKEDTAVTTVIKTITAQDPDTGPGGNFNFYMEPVKAATSSESDNVFTIDPVSGQIKVNMELDSNENNYYEYTLLAKDKGTPSLTGTSVLLIRIGDVQNMPPYFTNLPYSKQIYENVTKNTNVLQVTALDGDKGIRNNVTFSVVSGNTGLFDLDPVSGWISVKGTLDRDTPEVRQSGGVYAIYVKATETDSSQDLSKITATTLVTITVMDVNDNAPRFNSDTYEATIQENMQEGVPITFTGPGKLSFMNASDIDQGSNSHFHLSLEKDGKPYTDFAPIPSDIFSESSILIRVQNKSVLDYERTTSITFTIVARETDTSERRSSSATVTVKITDMNDNVPVFHPDVYPPSNVSEFASVSQEIVQINATDMDAGDNGKITYHIRGTNTEFQIDETSGVITLTEVLDREKVDSYFITAEARDGGGLTTFTNLNIFVLDENDNAPQFRREEYFGTLPEDSKTFLRGNLIVEAVDDDEPGTNNSEVRYRIKTASAGLTDKFAVNETSGLVTLHDTIDYESLPLSLNGRVILEIEAYDMGIPAQSSSVNVTVEIEDVNDNTPAFNQSMYTASVLESAKPDTTILQVFASDGDSAAPNNDFLYRIDSGAFDKFRIDFKTGEISVEQGAVLDREEKSQYVLNVSATDRGAVSLNGSCQVTITIDDVNDELPKFVPPTVDVSVEENAVTDFQVVCATATDPDTTASLTYSIVPNSVVGTDDTSNSVNVTATGVNDYFKINSSTGCLQVKSPLDRETVETVELHVMVQDNNAANGLQQTATAMVTITLEDFNDNAPEFKPNNTYSLRVSEGREPGSEIWRFETEDKDKDQGVSFEMGTNVDDSFRINENSGVLSLNKALDRETNPDLTITIIAKDAINPIQSSTATVHVSVSDVNDNTPYFETYSTNYSVSEEAVVNTTIATFTARDDDLGEYANIFYTFEVVNDDSKLQIDRNTGKVSVAKTLDRETKGSYTLYVSATDNPSDPFNRRTKQTKTITVTVQDVNDNAPFFTNTGPATQRMSVKKRAALNTLVDTVSAEDFDIGINAKLVYSLAANDTVGNLFRIETVSRKIGGVDKYFGEIRVNADLTDWVDEFTYNVTVTDSGSQPLSSQKGILIEVEDENTNWPVFVVPPGPTYQHSWLEDEPPGSTVITISATDKDHGRNAEISYSILEELDYEYFEIDTKTGVLRNRRVLDRETQAQFQIKIKAQDHGEPVLYEILNLIINLRDKNDNPPKFPRGPEYTPFRASIEEERTYNESTTNVAVAKDPDANENNITCYYIIGGDAQGLTHFQLEKKGNLMLKEKLDRESLEEPFVNLIIFATPDCLSDVPNDLRPPIFPPTDYFSNASILWVKVEILDINDNPPEFKQSVLSLGVTRDTGYATSLINLKDTVTDKDQNLNCSFRALRIEQYLQTQIVAEPFKVFPNGSVFTNTFFRLDMSGYFLIYVQAIEISSIGSPFVVNATIRISLINDDQRVKVVFKDTPENVRAFQVTFAQKLQNTTGYRIGVDKIQTHENQYGLPEVNKTDMFIHGEDMKTNATVSASELLRVIDANAEALLELRYRYKVLETVPVVAPTEEEDLENVFKMALILVAISLGLLCCAIAIVFYISREQYKRKLKAATAMAYGSSSDLQKLEMPGTNLHAYENVNPIYLEKVKLEEIGVSRDDDDNIDDNVVGTVRPDPYGEQQKSMNFYTEKDPYHSNNVSTFGTDTDILDAALRQHEESKMGNGSASTAPELPNGDAGLYDSLTGLPTTQI